MKCFRYSLYSRYLGFMYCGIMRVLAVRTGWDTASTGSTYGVNALDILSTPNISDAHSAGAATRGSALRIPPVLAVFGPSVLLILVLPVVAVVLQYSKYTRYANMLEV